MKEKDDIATNESTEELILAAARRVFTKKGYAATRTRDIAEESGFNLALINYYFRSKEKLFQRVMTEHIQTFVYSVMDLLNDETTSLQQKLEQLVNHYIDMIIANPDLPFFVLNEVNTDPTVLIGKLGLDKDAIQKPYIVTQWEEMRRQTNLPAYNPLHLLMNLAGLTIFPFIARPLIKNRTGIDADTFNRLMEERKRLIPLWIQSIIMTPIPPAPNK